MCIVDDDAGCPQAVAWQATPGGGVIEVTAKCGYPSASLVFTLDGSRPTATSQAWPSSGTLTLPPRTTAVNVKALPPAPAAVGAGMGGGAGVVVESPTVVVLVTPTL